jgi:hypothetical protein
MNLAAAFSRPPLPAIAVAAGLLACSAAGTAAASPAWTVLPSSATTNSLTQAAALRLPDGSLEVAYPAPDPADPTTSDMLTSTVTAGGVVAAGPPIATGWVGVDNPALLGGPGGLRALFSGMHTTTTGDPNNGLTAATAPAAGGPWTVAPSSVSGPNPGDDYSYAADQTAIALADGTAVEAWAGGSIGVFVHRGLDPAVANQNVQTAFGGCCGASPALAIDGQTHQPSLAWYSSTDTSKGVFVQGIDAASGAPLGAPVPVPGSQAGGESAPPMTRVAVTGRGSQPGVFVAIAAGYPVAQKLLVWHEGSPASVALVDGDSTIRNVAIAADPAGRLWVAWTTNPGNGPMQLFAARSDATGTTFGAPVAVALPDGADTSWALDASAQGRVVDVVGTFTPGPGGSGAAIWHTQVVPGDDVSATTVNVAPGQPATATVKVTDAGVPLAGATVSGASSALGRASAARHVSAKTNARGIARLKLGRVRHSTTLRLRVTKRGYVPHTVALKVHVRR